MSDDRPNPSRDDTPDTQPAPGNGEPPPAPESPTGYEAAPGAIRGDAPTPPAPVPPAPPAQPTPPPTQAGPPYPQPPYPQPPQQQPPRPYPQSPQPPYGQAPGAPPRGYAQPPWGQPPPPQPPGPYGGPGGTPPYGRPPAPRSRMIPLIIGVVVLIVVLGIGAIGLVITATSADSSGSTFGTGTGGAGASLSFFGDQIGVLEINGVIMEDEYVLANTALLVRQVRQWKDSTRIKAMVLRINSPGGAVSATQDLYHALLEFRETGKPILTSMGDVAASGGYYAAMASDEVYANEGTLTGSIGVILSFWNYEGLQEKIGISANPIKSGEFKDVGSGSRPMTEAERALLDEMVLDVFDQFFQVVVQGRAESVRAMLAVQNSLPPEDISDEAVTAHIRQFCDGRIFSGRQAASTGMVDGTLTLEQVLDRARELTGLTETTSVVHGPARPKPGLFGSANVMLNRLTNEGPNSQNIRLEYRLAH